MSCTSLVRRIVALTATTGLLTGALASGFAAPAFAAVPAATVTGVSPAAWDNLSTATFKVTGTNFAPGDQVVFYPCDVEPWTVPSVLGGAVCHTTANAAAHEVGSFSSTITSTPAPTDTYVIVKPNLAMAPSGLYYLTVKHSDGTESAILRNSTAPGDPTVTVRIYDIGAATLRSISNGVDSTGNTCDPTGVVANCARGAGALDLSGSNFAIGADVQFLTPAGSPDAGITFLPGNPGNGNNTIGTAPSGTGYPSATLIQGNYTANADVAQNTPAFVPGRHLARVVNTYASGWIRDSGQTVDFWQPWFRQDGVSVDTQIGTAATPSAEVGAGAQNVTVTVKGRGFRPGTTLAVATPSYPPTSPCSDVTVVSQTESAISPPDANGNDSMVAAKINVASCATPTGNGTPRSVTVTDPSGTSWSRAAELRINPAPVADTKSFATLGQGAAQQPVTVTGTGFQVGAAPAGCPSFDFGPGVTATTISCPGTTSATVQVDVGQDAAVGARGVTVTNPADKGSSTTAPNQATGTPLTIDAGPKIKSVSPPSFSPNGATVSVTITGTGFEKDSGGTTLLTLLDAAGNPYPSNQVQYTQAQVTKASVTGGDDQITFSLTVSPGTPVGRMTVVLTNQGDQGRYSSSSWFGIYPLTVSPVSAPNTGSTPLTLTGMALGTAHLGTSVGPHSTVTLTRSVPVPDQGPIVGTLPVPAGADSANTAVDLTSAALGYYDVTFVADSTNPSSLTWSCIRCFTATGTATGAVTITPNNGGVGATNRPVKITGTNFSHGMSVTIDGLTVHDVTFVSTTEVDAQVDIPSNAATGSHTVTVSAADGTSPQTTTFTVNAAPSPTAVSPAALGTGAGTPSSGTPMTLTVSGTGFDNDPATSFSVTGGGVLVGGFAVTKCTAVGGTCIPGSTDTLSATVVVAQTAAPGKRDIVVHNGDGGVATLAGAFTVNPGPKVLSVADPSGASVLRPDGVTHTMTVFGAGFVTSGSTSTLAISPMDGLKVGTITVVSATKITVDVTVDPAAARGPRTVSVTNPGDHGYGECAPPNPCVYVATAPGSAAPLRLAPGGGSLVASWAAAATNGAPVTDYRLSITRAGTTLPPTVVDVPGSTLSYRVTGLVNGVNYAVSVTPTNAAGAGPASSATGIAGLPSVLTLAASAHVVLYTGRVNLTGRLSTPSGAALPYRRLYLYFVPSLGRPYVRVVGTNLAGRWSLAVLASYSYHVRAIWYGDANYRPATTGYVWVAVAAKVVKTSPVSGYRSSASSILTVTGYVLPNKHGRIIYLYRYVNGRPYLVARARLAYRSTFAFTSRLGRGTYTLRVYFPASPGNAAGYSVPFRVYRT